MSCRRHDYGRRDVDSFINPDSSSKVEVDDMIKGIGWTTICRQCAHWKSEIHEYPCNGCSIVDDMVSDSRFESAQEPDVEPLKLINEQKI